MSIEQFLNCKTHPRSVISIDRSIRSSLIFSCEGKGNSNFEFGDAGREGDEIGEQDGEESDAGNGGWNL